MDNESKNDAVNSPLIGQTTTQQQEQEQQIQPQSQTVADKQFRSRPKFAFLMCLLSSISYATGYLLSKQIYLLDPTMTAFHLMFVRSVFSLFFLTIVNAMMNKSQMQKAYVFPWEKKWLVLYSVFNLCAVSFIVFYCTKYLPIVEVSIFINLGPLITVLLGVVILKERLGPLEIAGSVIAFTGVALIVIGAKQSQPDDEEEQTSTSGGYSLFLYFILILGPILLAVGNITLRTLKGLPTLTIPTLSNIFNILVFGIAILATSGSSDFQWSQLTGLVWLCMMGTAITSVLAWQTKLLGYRYDKVSRLATIFHLESVWTFMFDVLIYHVSFHVLAFIGIVMVLLFFIFKIVYTVCKDPDSDEKTPEQKRIQEKINQLEENTDDGFKQLDNDQLSKQVINN